MKTFCDLYIHLNGADIVQLASDLTDQCSKHWSRRKDKEDNPELTGEKPLCFESTGDAKTSPAALFIFPKSGDTWHVSNIVPTKTSELNYDEYNGVLEQFVERIVRPAIVGTKIQIELTNGEISIASIAGKEIEQALLRFSNLANKSTGSSHPLDRRRWFEFLILANEADADLDVDFVIRALIEQGWSEDKAYDLGLEFEFAEELLSYVRG